MFEFIRKIFANKIEFPIYTCDNCELPYVGTAELHRCPVGYFPEMKKEYTMTKAWDIFKSSSLHPEIPEENKKSFYNYCKDLIANDFFDRVVDEVVQQYAEQIIQTAESDLELFKLRNKMIGADEIRKRFKVYADNLEPPEPFNPHDPI